jgi:hypothetical protein
MATALPMPVPAPVTIAVLLAMPILPKRRWHRRWESRWQAHKKGGHWRPPSDLNRLGRRKTDPTDENDALVGLTKS